MKDVFFLDYLDYKDYEGPINLLKNPESSQTKQNGWSLGITMMNHT